MKFDLTRQFVDELKEIIHQSDGPAAVKMLENLYPADIAEILDELETNEARLVFFQLDPKLASDILVELEGDKQERFLHNIPAIIIAHELIAKMDSDDAADVLQAMPERLKNEILQHLGDHDIAAHLLDLLTYDEDTAGGLMAKELMRVNVQWDINACLSEFRRNSDLVGHAYNLHVVNDKNELVGILPIKKLLIYHGTVRVADVMDKEMISVNTDTPAREVAHIMDKYDLVVLPVTDSTRKLIGRITIDDVVDVIREERERDYQMLAGITEDIESSDNVFLQMRGRLPWLLIGMVGGIFGSKIIEHYQPELHAYTGLTMFLPLIAGMAGNVGVQASSIIVQSLAAENTDIQSPARKILKEMSVGMLNGSVCSAIVFAYNMAFSDNFTLTLSVSIALIIVIIFASVFGTIVPLLLNRMKIDPALATGPFISASNDIIGLFVYLTIGRIMFGWLG